MDKLKSIVTPELKNPRILFVDQSGQLGGAELFLLDIASEFKGCGVALFDDGPFREALDKKGLPTFVLGEGLKATKKGGLLEAARAIPSSVRFVAKLVRLVGSYQIVYANTAKALILGGIAARFAGKPLVYHLHDIVDAGHFSKLNRQLLVRAARYLANCVIANSQASKAAFVAAGYNKPAVYVIYNGFRAEEFPIKGDQSASPEVYDKKIPLVVMVGRLTPWKGQHVFVEALAGLPDVQGLIVGEALFTDEDQQYALVLRERVKNLGLSERVFFSGFCHDVAAVYAGADIVAHCSTAPEPFGRVIVEGMLAGKPVIATRLGGALEIITDKVTGLLIAADDPVALANAIQLCLSDPEQTGSMAKRGREHAIGTFSLEKVICQIRAVLGELIK